MQIDPNIERIHLFFDRIIKPNSQSVLDIMTTNDPGRYAVILYDGTYEVQALVDVADLDDDDSED